MASSASFLDAPHACVWHLCEKFYCRTVLSKVWIQLLLIFSLWFQPPHVVINLDPVRLIVTLLVLEERFSLQEFPMLSIFGFLLYCQNI